MAAGAGRLRLWRRQRAGWAGARVPAPASRESRADGLAVGELPMPVGMLLISVLHRRVGCVATPDTVLEAGDQVAVVAEPGQESASMEIFARE